MSGSAVTRKVIEALSSWFYHKVLFLCRCLGSGDRESGNQIKLWGGLRVCWNDAQGTVFAVGAFPVCPLKPLNSVLQSENYLILSFRWTNVFAAYHLFFFFCHPHPNWLSQHWFITAKVLPWLSHKLHFYLTLSGPLEMKAYKKWAFCAQGYTHTHICVLLFASFIMFSILPLFVSPLPPLLTPSSFGESYVFSWAKGSFFKLSPVNLSDRCWLFRSSSLQNCFKTEILFLFRELVW